MIFIYLFIFYWQMIQMQFKNMHFLLFNKKRK